METEVKTINIGKKILLYFFATPLRLLTWIDLGNNLNDSQRKSAGFVLTYSFLFSLIHVVATHFFKIVALDYRLLMIIPIIFYAIIEICWSKDLELIRKNYNFYYPGSLLYLYCLFVIAGMGYIFYIL
jgi:hypothetical protein